MIQAISHTALLRQQPVWSFCFVTLLGLLLPNSGCTQSPPGAAPVAAPDNPNEVLLRFPYGSEKQKWLVAVTERFHQTNPKTARGKTIRVEGLPMGSGEAIQTLAPDHHLKPHLISPASSVFIRLANAQSEGDKPIVGQTVSLVRSPVVIAMWKKMAEAIGYGVRPVGWAEVLEMVNKPNGWAEYDFPQWGKFKFGHTHPELSNSGLLTLLAIVYAANHKTTGLTLDDVQKPETAEFLRAIEQGVVHYGQSTGFFGKKMFRYGPENISAAVLYENMVLESYLLEPTLAEPIVAIYPKEGTFWSDHPVGIVQTDWVSDEHREAADKYIQFLLAREQQELSLQFGFRPGDPAIALQAPFDAAHGVNPEEPENLLEVPPRNVIEAVLTLWRSQKRAADVVLVLEIRGVLERLPGNRYRLRAQ